MKRQSLGAFTLKVSSLLTCVAAATATAGASPSSQPARTQRAGEKAVAQHGSRGGSSPWVTMKPCSVSDAGRFRFVSGRNPFMGGGGGAYGDIFFAGGGSARAESTPAAAAVHATAPETPAVVAAPAPTLPTQPPPRMATGPAPVTAPATVPTTATGPAKETPALIATRDPEALPPTGGASAIPVPTTGTVTKPNGGPAPISVSTPSAVNPEPASLMLIGIGLSGIAVVRRRRNRS